MENNLRSNLLNLMLLVIPLVILESLGRMAAFTINDFNPYYLTYGFKNAGLRLTYDAVPQDGYFKFKPNTYVTQGPLPHLRIRSRINNIGLRGNDVQVSRPERSVRVVTLGGSSTFGYHARDDHTYSALLQKRLERRFDGKVEVINAGVPNFDSENILNIFRNEMIEYSPDIITMYTGYNDAIGILDMSAAESVSSWLYDHSALYVGVAKALSKVLEFNMHSKWTSYVSAPSPEYIAKQISLHNRKYRRNVTAVIELARSRGIKVILIRQPMALTYRADPNRPDYADSVRTMRARVERGKPLSRDAVSLLIHAGLMDTLREIAAEYSIPVVDNVAIVDARKERLLTYVHLSEEGNDALSAELAKVVESELGE